ncbi:hypothetical protein QYE76_053282 [Lolium multiflorum]|uniref:Transposase MuDR plant domain-containing protein n=1 Tax=Lolium multiflorum TaxID=4521 RepID=A0AAD8WLT7_LOLMU|nr:hypothetical protein QYE76_053282 [Lolium multiflorum]
MKNQQGFPETGWSQIRSDRPWRRTTRSPTGPSTGAIWARSTVREFKTLSVMVDHNNFLQGLRTDVLVPIASKYTGGGDGAEQEKYIDEEPVSSACLSSGELQSEDEDDGDTDSDFYDSDYDCEDGDDDLFVDNIDKDVNDHNECTDIVEFEDDAGLDHDNLKLTNEQQKLLEYKFKEFNPEVDMATPIFKVGMLFSSMAEFRKALTAYGVNERVKIRKSRNEATRLDAHCEEGCPWLTLTSVEGEDDPPAVDDSIAQPSLFFQKYSLVIIAYGSPSFQMRMSSSFNLLAVVAGEAAAGCPPEPP